MPEDPNDDRQPADDSALQESPSSHDPATIQASARYPDIGYHLVKWARRPLPVDGMTPVADTNELTLSAMSVPQTQTFVEFTIEGSDGHTYTRDDFDAIPDDPDPAECTAVCDRIENTTGKPRRLALVHLTRITDAAPEAASAAVSTLVPLLEETPPAVQGEALGCLQAIAAVDDEAVAPAVAPVKRLLPTASSRQLRDACLRFLLEVARTDPSPLVETVPEFGALLTADQADPAIVSRVLNQISMAEPDALMPIVSKLELFLEQGPDTGRVGVLAALGRFTKQHPAMTKEIIPTARDLIQEDDIYVASNAAGLLADVADEYPEAVATEIDPFVQLLDHDDAQLRYNAVAVLTRVADVNPEAVEPLIPKLIDCLDDELVDTRFNACWALRYLDATAAVERLTEVVETDPNEKVQSVALHAIDGITE